MSDLIAAIATGDIRSAIGVIRLSGDGAIGAVDRVFRAKNGKAMANAPSGKLVYGGVYDGNGALLDTCLCTVSRAPHSYTGEDTAELQCHGSPVVLASVMEALFRAGARQALPGEFTKRAFLNGRMDLTAAEAVIDLIDAQTESAAKNASAQLAGAVTRRTDAVYAKLLDMVSHFHAVVDWPDEDIEDFEAEKYLGILEEAERTLAALLETFERGRVLKDGIPAAIIGRPNVGKSSLLNALLGYERAIVTPNAGTTRDTVEERCVLGGVTLRLADTAGLRETSDEAERIGVERAERAAEEARLVIGVFDGSEPMRDEDKRTLEALEKAQSTIAVINKADLPAMLTLTIPALHVSASTGEGLEGLSGKVRELFEGAPVPQGEILTNARQAAEVRAACEAVRAARKALCVGVTPDAVLTEIEAAMEALGRLTGRSVSADVTDRIFERFCVGK